MVDISRKLRVKTFYQTDADGVFVGEVQGHESPLEPGRFLVPAGAVSTRPPAFAVGKRARWVPEHFAWSLEDTPAPEPIPVESPAGPAFTVRWDETLGVWVADGLPAPGA